MTRPDKSPGKSTPDVANSDRERIDEAVLALLHLGLRGEWRSSLT